MQISDERITRKINVCPECGCEEYEAVETQYEIIEKINNWSIEILQIVTNISIESRCPICRYYEGESDVINPKRCESRQELLNRLPNVARFETMNNKIYAGYIKRDGKQVTIYMDNGDTNIIPLVWTIEK